MVTEHQGDLALFRNLSVNVGDLHAVTRQRTAHRADLHFLPRRIPRQCRGFGLAVAVADRQPPRRAHLIDHFGVERLTGAAHLAQRHLDGCKLLLNEQPPHRRRRAQRGDAAAADGRKQGFCVEARLVDHEHSRARIPRREEAAPGMLGPARRGNIQMDVARLQPEPEHRRQRADRIAALAVPHQFWFCGGARGEIEQHRVIGMGRAVRRKVFRRIRRLFERKPAVVLGRRTDHDADQIVAAEAGKLRDLILRGHHHPRLAAIEPVAQFVGRKQRGGGDHDHAEFHRRQHGLPQRRDIAEQQQQMITALHALRA